MRKCGGIEQDLWWLEEVTQSILIISNAFIRMSHIRSSGQDYTSPRFVWEKLRGNGEYILGRSQREAEPYGLEADNWRTFYGFQRK